MQRLMEDYRTQPREMKVNDVNSPSWIVLLAVIITGSLFIALLTYQLL
jgi:hypothetical protein